MKKIGVTSVAKGLTAMFALPEEVMLNLPLLSLVGGGELSVENHKGVVEYTAERLRVNTTAGVLKIDGRRLAIKQLTAERILVRGAIDSVAFIR